MMPKTTDSSAGTGAVRSNDGEHLDFLSLPVVGLFAVARTAGEGGPRYGRYNYMRGFSAWMLVNRALRHIFLWVLGDRSEPNLEHAAWGLLAAIQELALNGEEKHSVDLLGPGATMPIAMLTRMDAEKEVLAEFRKTPEAKALGEWTTSTIPEIAMLLKQRRPTPQVVQAYDRDSIRERMAKELEDMVKQTAVAPARPTRPEIDKAVCLHYRNQIDTSPE